MAKLTWGDAANRIYETGVSNCALYVKNSNGTYGNGVAWEGITAVTESPSGAESTKLYANNSVYLNMTSVEEFGATIEAYTYPEEFAQCNGEAELAAGVTIGQQARKSFGLIYKTQIGSSDDGDAHGYKYHIIYGCKAAPSEKAYQTINDSPEAITFSWELSTTPEVCTGFNDTSKIEIDSTKVTSAQLEEFEEYCFGTNASGSVEGTQPQFPTPAKIVEIFGTQG